MEELYDYDLNIFRREQLADSYDTYEYVDPWYIHIYTVDDAGHSEYSEPIELTKQEARLLGLGLDDGYFNTDDCWYGLDGFLKDYQEYISPRLMSIIESLPKYKSQVLF